MRHLSIHIAEPDVNVIVYNDELFSKKQYKFSKFDKLLVDKFIKFFGSTVGYYLEDNLDCEYYPVILVFTKKNNLIVFKYVDKDQTEIYTIKNLKDIELGDNTEISKLPNDEILKKYKVQYNHDLHEAIEDFIMGNELITKDLI